MSDVSWEPVSRQGVFNFFARVAPSGGEPVAMAANVPDAATADVPGTEAADVHDADGGVFDADADHVHDADADDVVDGSDAMTLEDEQLEINAMNGYDASPVRPVHIPVHIEQPPEHASTQVEAELGDPSSVLTSDDPVMFKGVVDVGGCDLAEIPLCIKCKMPVDVLKARCTGKKQGSWKCPRCNSRHVNCINMFGQWPIHEFVSLTDEEQLQFWRAPGGSGMDVIERLVMDFVLKMKMEQTINSRGGSFLPLTVYEKAGFDIDRIVAKSQPSDISDDPVLGCCYRVRITTTMKNTVENLCRAQLVTMRQQGKRQGKQNPLDLTAMMPSGSEGSQGGQFGLPSLGLQLPQSQPGRVSAALPQIPQLLQTPASSERGSGDESSRRKRYRSSSSSSESSSARKQRKALKAKRKSLKEGIARKAADTATKKALAEERKETDKLKRAAEQEVRKHTSKVKADSNRIIFKLTPLKAEFELQFRNPNTSSVHESVIHEAKREYAVIGGLINEATQKLAEECPASLSVTIGSVQEVYATAKKSLDTVCRLRK